MDIEIGDRYRLKRDKYQWILTRLRHGENKKGEPVVTTSNTYHATLDQVAKKLLFEYPSHAQSLTQLAADFAMCVLEIECVLENVTRQAGDSL